MTMGLISELNWAVAHKEGWRWVQDLGEDPEYDCLKVAQLVEELGSEHVQVGTRFGTRPCDLAGFALYACDADVLVAELGEDLLNFECGHSMYPSSTAD